MARIEFTDDEKDTLRKMVLDGYTLKSIAEELGRPIGHMRVIAHNEGYGDKIRRIPSLRALVDDMVPLDAVDFLLGVIEAYSNTSVMLAQMALPDVKLTPAQADVMTVLIQQQGRWLSMRDIALATGSTTRSVATMVSRIRESLPNDVEVQRHDNMYRVVRVEKVAGQEGAFPIHRRIPPST